ncbi:MAG: nuclear transport factor 2 family protein [Gemmataceae bacterium]|nr:nuclear transport factor 2 family protein [Gemmataceae bacterium]
MRILVVSLTVLVAGIGILWAGGQQGGAAANDEAGVKAAIEAYCTSLKSGDLATIMANWVPDADFTDESGNLIKGREAISRLFVGTLADLKAGKTAFKIDTLRFLSADVVVMDGALEFTPPDGSVESNRFSAVWAKKGGKWMIASARDLPETEGQAADRGLREMQWLTGEWVGEDKGTTIRLTVKPELNGKFALMKYEVKGPKETMTIIQVLGWDPTEGALRSWTFDSRGGFGESAWVRDGSVWAGDTTGVLPSGQVGTALNIIRLAGPNSFVWQSTQREVGGQPIPDHEIKYTRVVGNR